MYLFLWKHLHGSIRTIVLIFAYLNLDFMHSQFIFSLLAIAFIIASCSPPNSTKAEPIAISTPSPHIDGVQHFFIPKDSVAAMVIIMDAQGKPNPIVDSLQTYAQEHHLALFALSTVKNGMSQSSELIQQAITQIRTQLGNPSLPIILLGFSGTARMVADFAKHNAVEGLVMCGAGVDLSNPPSCLVALVAGFGDFNFYEVFYTPDHPVTQNRKLMSFFFEGKHHWPNRQTLESALDFVWRKNANPHFAAQGNQVYQQFKNLEWDFKTKGGSSELLHAFAMKQQSFFDQQKVLMASEKDKAMHYFELLQQSKVEEASHYIDQLVTGDRSNDFLQSTSQQRVASILGIMLYQQVQNSLQNQQIALSEVLMQAYQKIEPENVDLQFFKSVWLFQKGSTEEAKAQLMHSRELGFSNNALEIHYFPDSFLKGL